MGLEISQIKNAELIKAAKQADQEAESATAKNGVLDESELSLFVQKAGNAVTQDETVMEEFTEILGLVRTQQKTPVPEKTETKIERQETYNSYPANTEHVSMETILEVLKAKGVNLSRDEKEQLAGMFSQANTQKYSHQPGHSDDLLTIDKGEFDNFLKLVKNSGMKNVADALRVDNAARTKHYFNEIEKNKSIAGYNYFDDERCIEPFLMSIFSCIGTAYFGMASLLVSSKIGLKIIKSSPIVGLAVGLGLGAKAYIDNSKRNAEADIAKSRLEQLKNEF